MRFQHRGFRQFIGARFDHHDGIGRPGHHQMEIAGLQGLQIGIHDKLALHPADFHTGDGPLNGIYEIDKAAEAAIMPITSVTPVLSADKTEAMTWVSK